MNKIRLGSKIVSETSPAYIIAEIGVNHGGSIEKAFELIKLAKEGGADAAKFQSYKAGRIASRYSPAYWDLTKEPTRSQYELFKKYDSFSSADYERLAAYCTKVGIDFISTPFDRDAVEFLDPLMSFFKIASADITNTPFLRQIAGKGKPIVLSTGASNIKEIQKAIDVLVKTGATDIALLHCILNYPTPHRNAHLNMIDGLRKMFSGFVIGYSDHTLPDDDMTVLTAAFCKGATIIEKHFTHDKSLEGNDHYHAMDVKDLKKYRENEKFLLEIFGDKSKHPLETEEPARMHARRSVVAEKNLKKGDIIKESDLTCKRPAHGICPVHWDEVIGRKLKRDVVEDSSLQWDDLE